MRIRQLLRGLQSFGTGSPLCLACPTRFNGASFRQKDATLRKIDDEFVIRVPLHGVEMPSSMHIAAGTYLLGSSRLGLEQIRKTHKQTGLIVI